MAGNYNSRKVGRYDGENGMFVSTAYVNDAEKPYETAVHHPRYHDGNKMTIVETYDTKTEAKNGHAK